MFTVIDQQEERSLSAMDQRDAKVDEWVALLVQSLHNIFECLQALQLSQPTIPPDPLPIVRVYLGDELL